MLLHFIVFELWGIHSVAVDSLSPIVNLVTVEDLSFAKRSCDGD
jgi:hypothetical protein